MILPVIRPIEHLTLGTCVKNCLICLFIYSKQPWVIVICYQSYGTILSLLIFLLELYIYTPERDWKAILLFSLVLMRFWKSTLSCLGKYFLFFFSLENLYKIGVISLYVLGRIFITDWSSSINMKLFIISLCASYNYWFHENFQIYWHKVFHNIHLLPFWFCWDYNEAQFFISCIGSFLCSFFIISTLIRCL